MFCTPQTTDIKIGQGKWQLPGVPKNQNQWELISLKDYQRLVGKFEAKYPQPNLQARIICHQACVICAPSSGAVTAWSKAGRNQKSYILNMLDITLPTHWVFQHRVGDSSDILVQTVKTQCKHARKTLRSLPGSVEFASLHPAFEVLPQAPPRRHSLDDTWLVSMIRVDTHCYKIWVLAHEFYWNFSTKPEALAVLLWGASRQDCSDRTLTAWLSVKTSWPSTSTQNCHWYKH